jgi:hypothetical protein
VCGSTAKVSNAAEELAKEASSRAEVLAREAQAVASTTYEEASTAASAKFASLAQEVQVRRTATHERRHGPKTPKRRRKGCSPRWEGVSPCDGGCVRGTGEGLAGGAV